METKGRTDQRIVLHNVSWETYRRLPEERGEERVIEWAQENTEPSS